MKYVNSIESSYDLVHFGSNKYQAKHRWYNLIEGYSSEFVRRIIGEQSHLPHVCLDPFGGVGTTSLTCQELGIKCYSFESNPFFFEVAQTKLRNDVNSYEFALLIDDFEQYLRRCKKEHRPPELETETLFEREGADRWVFSQEVTNAIVDITNKIQSIDLGGNGSYASLFRIAIAEHLISFSNVFKNGKCLAYRKNWKEINISRKEVHTRFIRYCREVILVDIRTTENLRSLVHNHTYVSHGDARKQINFIPDDSVDLVITSPPYLNSRDYTDIYRLELWVLGYVRKYEEERKIRRDALTSHVQIQLEEREIPKIAQLHNFVSHLKNMNGSLWNKNIPRMVQGYFADMEQLFKDLHPKLTKGALVYLNVSNSAYGGQVCEVDTLLGEIANQNGYKTKEIRTVRMINSSKQQQIQLNGKLRESVVVMEKK